MPRTAATTLRVATAIAACLLAALALAACGGSSKSSSSSAAAPNTQAATTPGASSGTTGTGATGTTGTSTTPALSTAAIAYRTCLEAHGAGLPKLVPGKSGAGAVAGGRLELPKGVSQATYEAAVRACTRSLEGGKSKIAVALKQFATCMRANGVNVPDPNKSTGLTAYLRQLNTPKLQPALKKCGNILRSVTSAKPGAKTG